MGPSPTALLLAAALFMAAGPAFAADEVDSAKSGGEAKPEPRLIAGDAAASEFLRRIYGKDHVENGDVLLAAALMLDEVHFADDAKWALKVARGKRLVRGRSGPDLDARASRGFACQVFARALGIGGGLWMRVSNDSPRYAYQELFQLGLIPDGGGHLSITGDELAGLLQNAMRYKDVGPERPPGR